MNTRFQDLARQSGATDEHGSQATTAFCFTAPELDGFVERIVRECIKCSEWVGSVNTTPVEPIHTARAVSRRIKKQFGIE